MICPLCTSDASRKIETYTASGYDFYNCPTCDGIFADPMRAAGKDWYEKCGWYDFEDSEPSAALRWYEQVFLKDRPNNSRGLLLNIGCGRNIFLRLAKEAGYEIFALDFNETAIKFTRQKLGIENALAMDTMDFVKNYKGSKFDVIVLFEVIEHLQTPSEFFRNLAKVLKPDGHVVLSVPNRDRIGPQRHEWDYPPHHLSRWSHLSLRKFLEFNGYLVERLLISPITANDLISGLKSRFKTTYIENKIRMADTKKTDKKILTAYVFNILFKMRMFFYKIMAFTGNILVRRKGLNIYAISRLKNNQGNT